MNLQQIATLLDRPDPQQRIKGIVKLGHHSPENAVPLLKQRMFDSKFLFVRFQHQRYC
ncbi:MAG: hypothetical protein AB4040_15605 [Synechococcus sp.]